MDSGKVGRIYYHGLLTRITGILERLAGGVEVAGHGVRLIGFVERAAGGHARADAPQAGVIAEGRAHVVVLFDSKPDGTAQADVVERRLRGVEAHQRHTTLRVVHRDGDVAV